MSTVYRHGREPLVVALGGHWRQGLLYAQIPTLGRMHTWRSICMASLILTWAFCGAWETCNAPASVLLAAFCWDTPLTFGVVHQLLLCIDCLASCLSSYWSFWCGKNVRSCWEGNETKGNNWRWHHGQQRHGESMVPGIWVHFRVGSLTLSDLDTPTGQLAQTGSTCMHNNDIQCSVMMIQWMVTLQCSCCQCLNWGLFLQCSLVPVYGGSLFTGFY